MAKTTLTISSKNYSSWSLRGWLLTKFSGLEFEEVVTAPDDASARAEILLLSSSILVPCLRHQGATVWDTLAIAEYLNEVCPDAGLLPADRVDRARAGLYFARWFPLRQPEWTAALKDLWERGLSISDLSGEDEQVALLEVSHAVGVEADAILSALDSRFAAVREAAARGLPGRG